MSALSNTLHNERAITYAFYMTFVLQVVSAMHIDMEQGNWRFDMAHIVPIDGMPIAAAGRVGLCQKAIQEALDMGFSKKEIAHALGLSYMTFFRAWKARKIVVPEERQMPLPFAPAQVKPRQAKQEQEQSNPVSKSGIISSNVIDLDDPANQ